jgi:drug/metabolite transporter (DMT)-like permease
MSKAAYDFSFAPILKICARAFYEAVQPLAGTGNKALLYQLLGAFVLLLIAAATSGQLSINPTPSAWGGLIFQTLIVSFASFLVWFWLLRHYLASRLGVLSFMTPIFGVVLGAWLLNEPIEPTFVAGALMVLTGIGVVSGYEWLRVAAREMKSIQ